MLPFIKTIPTPIRKMIRMLAGIPAKVNAQVGWLNRRYQERPIERSRKKDTESKLNFVRMDSSPQTSKIRMSIVQAIQKRVVIVLQFNIDSLISICWKNSFTPVKQRYKGIHQFANFEGYQEVNRCLKRGVQKVNAGLKVTKNI